ncbi:MAG: acyltransferase [Flavobacteriales bacterium]|nr:acyltransferase [Flavobacteriales bacterium]
MNRVLALPGLDHLRALAIVLVFVYHYGLFAHPAWIESIGAFGWIGVDLFFVLSGYLIADQLFRSQARTGTIGLRAFYLRRAFRILPAYGVMVALYFLFPLIQERATIAPLWKFITFTLNLGLDLRKHGTFSHAWSLCVEEHFYLVLPLVLLGLQRLRVRNAGWSLSALVVVGLVWRSWAWHVGVPVDLRGEQAAVWFQWLYYPTPSRLDGLLMGIAIAAAMHYRRSIFDRARLSGTTWLLCGGAFLLLAWWFTKDRYGLLGSVVIFPLVSLGFGCWLLAMLQPNFRPANKAIWLTRHLAELAFCLYLTHKAAIHCTQEWLTSDALPVDGSGMFFCCALASVMAALALRFAVERPFLALRDRWT